MTITVEGKQALKDAERSSHPLARCLPRYDRVLVKRDLAPDESPGGVLLPDSVKNQKRQTGYVIRVGPGVRDRDRGRLVPIDLLPGQAVIIAGYAGLEISDQLGAQENAEYVLLRDDDVVAVLPEK